MFCFLPCRQRPPPAGEATLLTEQVRPPEMLVLCVGLTWLCAASVAPVHMRRTSCSIHLWMLKRGRCFLWAC
jgi:hypothetical protein